MIIIVAKTIKTATTIVATIIARIMTAIADVRNSFKVFIQRLSINALPSRESVFNKRLFANES